MPQYRSKHAIILMLLLLLFPGRAQAGEQPDTPLFRPSPASHPAAETLFTPASERPEVKTDPAWYVRTGAKKGLIGRADTNDELIAAPDTAILARGFFEPWQAILAEYQEPVILVRPEEIAGLSSTKPLLIIPSGALSGSVGSSFFKASLADYVGSGGTVFCLTQMLGTDYSALPLPEGQALKAAGWSEDGGPLFRASAVRTSHPLVAHLSVPVPVLETDGYFISYPSGSLLLLARPDGYPVLIAYPFGKGWVVLTTLFTDFSSLLGRINGDEKTLLRDLLSWSKEASRPVHDTRPSRSSETPPAVAANGQNKTPAQGQAANVVPARLVMRASVERKGENLSLALDIPPSSQFLNEPVLVRAGEQERSITLSKDRSTVSFDIPLAPDERRISCAVYRSDGRALARASVPVPPILETSANPAQAYSFPGDKALVNFTGMGKGEVTVLGAGFLGNKIISERGSMPLSLPKDLPAGTYRMTWSVENIRSEKKEGSFFLDLAGYRVAIDSVSIEATRNADRITGTAKCTISATATISGRLQFVARGPDGRTTTLAEPVLSLVEGTQAVPVPFSFAPGAAGLWSLGCSFSTTLPDRAALPSEPQTLASADTLFDVGDAAVLAVIPDSVFYYLSSGAPGITAVLAGSGKTSVEVRLDQQRVSRADVEIAGLMRYHAPLPTPGPGLHTVQVTAARDGLTGSRELPLTYGLLLPDLAISLHVDSPGSDGQLPVLPVTMTVMNRGKSLAGPSRAGLYEGDPSRGGSLITMLDVPPLEPREQRVLGHAWPLYRKAGTRTLFAAADAGNALRESNKNNNKASAAITLPALLLLPRAADAAFGSSEPVAVPLSVFNLTDRDYRGLVLSGDIADPSGRTITTGNLSLPPVSAGTGTTVAQSFRLSVPPAGTYRYSARVAQDATVSSASTPFRVLPTLLVTGSLDKTPSTALLCKPFTLRFRTENAGNVYPSSGTLRLEISPDPPGKPLFTKRLPFNVGEQTSLIDTLDLPQGRYVVRLSAAISDIQRNLWSESVLEERPLSVSGPVEAARIKQGFPRLLVWIGREGRVVEQALSESIVKQAFDGEDLLYRIVSSEEEFSTQAKTGMFNTFVLFDPHEMPEKTGWLTERRDRGQGIIVLGAGESARSMAAELGFTFEELRSKKGPQAFTFPEQGGLGLTGTVPVSGTLFSPRKSGAVPVAVYASSQEPAAMLDTSGKGKVIVIPASLGRSSYEAGAIAPYGLVLRSAALSAAPDHDDAGEVAAAALLVSSRGEPVNARVRETLPAGSEVLWTNAGGKIEKNGVSYELKLNRDPQKLLYLYRSADAPGVFPSGEVFFECGGSFVSQGKVE